MPTLTFECDGRRVDHDVPDSGSWRVRIGAGAHCELRLDVAGSESAAVWGQDGKVFVEDLGGGTCVDGQPIDFPARLRAGDGFEVAGVTIRYEAGGTGAGAEAPVRVAADVPVQAAREVPSDHTVMLRNRAPRAAAAPARSRRIRLEDRAVVLGRNVDGPGRIEDVLVSRQHAELRRSGTTWEIRDAGSTNGTYVDGAPVDGWTRLSPGQVIALGPVLLAFDGRSLRSLDDAGGIRVDALDVARTVQHRDTGAPLNLLNGISLSVMPGEFVAMLGSSGCGKSTFMDAMNARRRATSGTVLYNGRNLYEEFPSLKRRIGHVPQDVVFHRDLPVEDVLRAAARLRLPTDTTGPEIDAGITEVLEKVGLSDRRRTVVRALSGGQQKRVAIAAELLSRPAVLFLDEVTSGLDLRTEREMMRLFRRLAEDGITVFCITHHLDSLDFCHHVAYFVGGRLAFFGPEAEMLRHFEIERPVSIYDRETETDPEAWVDRYVRSETGGRLLTDRLATVDRSGTSMRADADGGAERVRMSAVRTGIQVTTLTRRFVQLLLADRATLGVILSLAPVTAGLIAFAAQAWPDGRAQALTVAYMAITSAFFLGLFTSSREIVKELGIYLHERMIGIEIVPYLVSKIVPLAAVNLVQVLALVAILRVTTDFVQVGSAAGVSVVLLAVALCGTMLGLVISATVRRTDAATSLMVFAVVPQLLFAGNFAELEGPQGLVARTTVSSWWAYGALESMAPAAAPAATPPATPAAPPAAAPRRGRGFAPPPPSPAPGPVPVPVPVSGERGWGWSVLVLAGQGLALGVAAFLLLLRRDGPDALRRFFSGAGRILEPETREQLDVREWVAGAREGLLRG